MTLEANPGPDERGDAAAQRRRRRHAALARRPERDPDASCAASGAVTAPGDVAAAVAAARAAGIGSVSLDLLYDIPDQTLATWIDHARCRPGPRAGPPLALRPDPRRPRRRGPDRPGRRPPADGRRAPAAGATQARPRPGRRPGGRDVPPRGRPPGRGRLARLRDQQLGPAGPREPAQPGLLASACRTKPWARAPTRSTGRPAAGTRRASTDTSRRSPPPDGSPPRLPPGGVETLDPADRGRRGAHPGAAHGRRGAVRPCSTIRRSAGRFEWASHARAPRRSTTDDRVALDHPRPASSRTSCSPGSI